MKRKGLLLLVLVALVAGGAFAQKVGDTGDFMGKNYTVQEVRSNGSLVLKPKAEGLDGVWKHTGGVAAPLGPACTYTFSGTTAVLSSKPTGAVQWSRAIERGYWKVGEPVIRNIKSTGAGKWSCEVLQLTFKGNGIKDDPIGTEWTASRIEEQPDGKNFRLYESD